MAESKRTGIKGIMNKDLDDRLIPEGQYRDALNITVGHSEGSDVGAIENVRGNSVVGGSGQDSITGTVIGSVVDSETGRIYYFVSETDHDAIYEYNPDSDTVSTVLIDGSTPGASGGGSGSDDDSDGGGGGGSNPTETFTVSVTSFTGTVVDVNQGAGSSTYKISLSAAATSTGDGTPPTSHNIGFFKFEETDSGGTALASQPGSDFGSDVAAVNNAKNVETNTISKAATTRYFKVTAKDQNSLTATDTVTVSVSAGVAGLSGSAVVPSSVTQGQSLSLGVSSVSGGIPPYSYSWTGPNSFTSSSSSPTVTSSASSVHAGQYNVVISDSASPANSITRGGSVSVTTFGTPTVSTLAASGANVTEIQFNGNVTGGGSPGTVSSRGFYYYANSSSTSAPLSTVVGQGTSVTEGGTGNGTFSKIVQSLTGSTHYDYVAWAHNGSNEGRGTVMRATTLASGTQSIAFSPTSLTDKPHQSATYAVTLTLNNLPDSNLTTSVSYATGGTGWISSIVRRSGTNIYDIAFGAMTVQSSTSPANRVASITFTNPSSGTTAQLSCHQTTNASIALTANSGTPNTTINKLGGTFGVDATVSFDPAGSQAGQWSFYDTLPSWITPAPNSSYLGTTTVSFNIANNTSGADRNHTFDARINDANSNNDPYWTRDTLSISQNQIVNFKCYEYQDLTTSQKTSLSFYKSNGAFQQVTGWLGGVQGSNTNDNVLRMTASPFGSNASEVTSIQFRLRYVFGGTYGNNGGFKYSIGGSTGYFPTSYTNVPGITVQGGQFSITVTNDGTTNTGVGLSRILDIRVGNGSSYDTHSVTLSRTVS